MLLLQQLALLLRTSTEGRLVCVLAKEVRTVLLKLYSVLKVALVY